MSETDYQTSFALEDPKQLIDSASTPDERYKTCLRVDEALKQSVIKESKSSVAFNMPLLEGLMIQLDRKIMSETNMFAWGWSGPSRNREEIHRQYIVRAIRDIYYPQGVKAGDQPGTTIYPGVCAASQETLNLLAQFNDVKNELKFHLSFLNKFKYKTPELRDGEAKAVLKRLGEQALAELNIGQIHKTKLYRQAHYTDLPIHKIGMFWGTSPKVECVSVKEAIDLACERVSYSDGKETVRSKLLALPPATEVAYINLVQGVKSGPDDDKELVPFRRTAPRLNYHYYALSDRDNERKNAYKRSFSKQQTAVMPFFYLHRPDVEIDVSELAEQMVVRDRAWRGHQYLKDKPYIVGENFEIYEYTVQPRHRRKNRKGG